MFVFDEIGSEYSKADIRTEIKNQIKDAVYTASGRAALSAIIESAKFQNRVVLLPGYTCQHIVEPFSWNEWEIQFYHIKENLSIDLSDLEKKLTCNPGCILLESYYGFSTTQSAKELICNAQKTGSIVIEDITHSFLGVGVTYPNCDYYFCSLRKWSGICDGGYAVDQNGGEIHVKNTMMADFFDKRRKARKIKQLYIKTGDNQKKEEYLRLYQEAEETINQDITPYRMSEESFEDFVHLDFSWIAKKRRENYLYLLNHIKSKYIKIIFEQLEEEAVPIMMPVYIPQHRSKIREILRKERIYCPIHWPIPVQLKKEVMEKNRRIYETILSVPCDQRYNINDMKRVVEVVNQIE